MRRLGGVSSLWNQRCAAILTPSEQLSVMSSTVLRSSPTFDWFAAESVAVILLMLRNRNAVFVRVLESVVEREIKEQYQINWWVGGVVISSLLLQYYACHCCSTTGSVLLYLHFKARSAKLERTSSIMSKQHCRCNKIYKWINKYHKLSVSPRIINHPEGIVDPTGRGTKIVPLE